MLHSDRRAFPPRIAAALAAALLLFCLPAAASDEESSSSQAAPVVTDADCQEQWNESEASDSCAESSIAAEASMCRVQVNCKVTSVLTVVAVPIDQGKEKKNSPSRLFNNVLASLDDVADMHNCNGLLTVGDC